MFGLAFLIVTCVVGAGFATGAELLAFFGRVALPPVVIAAWVAVLFFAMIVVIVFSEAAIRNKAAKRGVDLLFAAVYFVFFVAMTAGVAQILGRWAAAVSLLFCVSVVCFGYDKMVAVNKYLTLFIVGFLVVVCVANLGDGGAGRGFAGGGGLLRGVGMAALYSAMNCCMLVAVVAKAREKQTRSTILWAAAFASCVVFLLVVLVLTAIGGHFMEAMPILAVSSNVLTTVTILAAIVTSQYVALFNVAELLTGINKTTPPCAFPKIVRLGAICAAAFVVSLFGFTKILGVFYPAVGGAMLVYLGWGLVTLCRAKIRARL